MVVLGVACFCGLASAQTSALDAILSIGSSSPSAKDKVSFVREQVLKESAVVLGARLGLSDRSRELLAVLEGRAAALDARYNFNPLVIGASVLPPVISESRDVVALEAAAMRVAGAVFRIDEPARFAMPTPTWRDWLYVGLEAATVSAPSLGDGGPATAAEKLLWQRLIKDSYEQGRNQAQAVFDSNLALLGRVHAGMQKYFDLLKAGGSKHHSELLAPFGLDARDPEFWNKGLRVIEGMIDELEAMEKAV